MNNVVFMQKVVVWEPGSVVPVGTIIDFVGTEIPDHMLVCNGAAYKRRYFAVEFAESMRTFTSWWRWHLLRQFRVPVFPTQLDADFGADGEYQAKLEGDVVPPPDAPTFEEFKQWVNDHVGYDIQLSPYQEQMTQRYYEEPMIEQQDDLGRTLMIPRRDPRYDQKQKKRWWQR